MNSISPPNPSEAAREAAQGKSDMSVQTYNAYDLFGDGTAPRVVLFTDHQSALAEREQRIKVLEKALYKYGSHAYGCRYETVAQETDSKFKYMRPDGSYTHLTTDEINALCDCGLDETRAALAATEGEKQ